MSLNKQEFYDEVAEFTEEESSTVRRVLDAAAEVIAEELEEGGEVAFPPLGKFETRKQAARTARNPQTGESIKVKAKNAPKFKPAKALKDRVA